MRILQEDENHLVFIVYPTKYFLLFMIFLIFVFVYSLFHSEMDSISGFLNFLNVNLSATDGIIAGTILTIVMLIITLSLLITSCLIPIRVDINKIAKKITYRYLAYAPIRAVGESSFKMIKVIPINDLQKLIYTNKIPEVPIAPGIHSAPYAIAKYCFMLKNLPSVNVYVGVFSQFSHRYAFMKIAEYLKIPYENAFRDETKSIKFLEHASNNAHLIRILLFILMGLILLLVLFVGAIFLVGFLSRWQ